MLQRVLYFGHPIHFCTLYVLYPVHYDSTKFRINAALTFENACVRNYLIERYYYGPLANL